MQARLQNIWKALMEIPYLTELMTDSGVAAAQHSGLVGGWDTPPSGLPIIRNKCPASPAVAPEHAACPTEPLSTSISKNNTWRQVRPEGLAPLAHQTSIVNQDAMSI